MEAFFKTTSLFFEKRLQLNTEYSGRGLIRKNSNRCSSLDMLESETPTSKTVRLTKVYSQNCQTITCSYSCVCDVVA